jgi:hypothetical protein
MNFCVTSLIPAYITQLVCLGLIFSERSVHPVKSHVFLYKTRVVLFQTCGWWINRLTNRLIMMAIHSSLAYSGPVHMSLLRGGYLGESAGAITTLIASGGGMRHALCSCTTGQSGEGVETQRLVISNQLGKKNHIRSV